MVGAAGARAALIRRSGTHLLLPHVADLPHRRAAAPPPRRSRGIVAIVVARWCCAGRGRGAGLAGWAAWARSSGDNGATAGNAAPPSAARAERDRADADVRPRTWRGSTSRSWTGAAAAATSAPGSPSRSTTRTPRARRSGWRCCACPRSSDRDRSRPAGGQPGRPRRLGRSTTPRRARWPSASRSRGYFDIVGLRPARGRQEHARWSAPTPRSTDAFLAADPDPDTPAEVATARPARRAQFGAGLPDAAAASWPGTSPPSRPPRTWTSCAPRWVSGSWTTSARRTAPSSAPPTPTCSRPTSAGWSSTARSTRPCPTSSSPSGRPRGFETALHAYVEDCVTHGRLRRSATPSRTGSTRIRQLLDADRRASRCRPSTDRQLTEGLAHRYGVIYPLYVKELLAAADRTR